MKIQILKRNKIVLNNNEVLLMVSDEPVNVPKPIADNLDSLWDLKW